MNQLEEANRRRSQAEQAKQQERQERIKNMQEQEAAVCFYINKIVSNDISGLLIEINSLQESHKAVKASVLRALFIRWILWKKLTRDKEVFQQDLMRQ